LGARTSSVCGAVFVAALDQTMVLTVMPSIMRSLYIDVRNLNDAGWIITAYLLAYRAMPLFGRWHVWGRVAPHPRPRPVHVSAAPLRLPARLDPFVAARVHAAGGAPSSDRHGAADMFPVQARPGARHHRRGGGSGGVLGLLYGAALKPRGAGGSSSW
jgi:hypothetical protein